MDKLNKLSSIIGRFMALIVLAVTVFALCIPKSCLWIKTEWINYLLMIVMFCMGLTLKPSDFKVVFTRPKDILIGCAAQFIIMPSLAFILGKLFGLETALLAGVVLVGTCPGGTASNVITYLSKGDVALSVGMTSVNTLIAPVLTPALTYLLLRTSVDVDVVGMFLSMIQIVVIPIVLGLVIGRFFGKYTQKVVGLLPMISVISITMIVAAVVSHNAEKIFSTGLVVFIVVMLHNFLGYLSGWLIGMMLKMPLAKKKALSVEIGMQNAGLATSLASASFASMPLAAVPGAVFSICHNITGAVLAGFFRKIDDKH